MIHPRIDRIKKAPWVAALTKEEASAIAAGMKYALAKAEEAKPRHRPDTALTERWAQMAVTLTQLSNP